MIRREVSSKGLQLLMIMGSAVGSYAQTPAIEYVRLGNRVIATENIGPPAINSTTATAPVVQGTSYSSTVTISVTDPLGYSNISVVDLLMNFALDGTNACYVAYVPTGGGSGSLYLLNNAGNGYATGNVTFSGGTGSGSTTNSQCTITGAGSTVTSSGTLTLALKVTFLAGFAGTKVLWSSSGDAQSRNSGWQAAGAVTIPGATATNPAVSSILPASGSAWSGTFSYVYTDTNGWQNGIVDILLNSALDGRSACYAAYVYATNTLLLVDDAGDAGGPYAGSITFSTGGVGSGFASNSQCAINGAGSSVSFASSGTLMTLVLSESFTPSFGGDRIFYDAAVDSGCSPCNSGWMAMASWTVPGGSPVQVVTPTFSPGPGTYYAPQTVSLSTTTAGASVYYTTNGTTPTTSSTLYTGPINVSSTTTIEAIASLGATNSSVATGTYTVSIAGAGVYDDRDARVSYSGTWYQNNYSSLYASTQTYSNAPGSSVSFAFTGTTVSYVYGMASNLGYANVYIDGTLVSTNLDEYSAPTGSTENSVWQKLVTYTGLSSGTHTIKVVVTGSKNPGATDSYITVDAFIVGTSRNDNDPAVAYTGAWTPGTVTGLWQTDEHYSNITGNSFTFSFASGNVCALTLYAGAAPQYGGGQHHD